MKLQQSNHKICIVGVKEMGDKGEKNFVEIIAKKKKRRQCTQRDTQFQGEKFRSTSRNIIKLLRAKYKRKVLKTARKK